MPFKPGITPEGAKPFKKGQTGNPNGRPKMPDLKEAISKILSEEKNGQTALDAVLIALFKKALNGDVRAAQELLDGGFGKSQQNIDLSTLGQPLSINVNFMPDE